MMILYEVSGLGNYSRYILLDRISVVSYDEDL